MNNTQNVILKPGMPIQQPRPAGPGFLSVAGKQLYRVTVATGSALGKTTQKVFDAATRTLGSVKAFQQLMKLAVQSLAVAELLKGPLSAGEKVIKQIKTVSGVIDTTSVIGETNYFLAGEYKKDDEVKIAANVTSLIASVAGAANWFRNCGVFSLAGVSSALGKVPVFGLLNQMSLGTFSLGAATVALALTTMSAATRIAEGKNVGLALSELVESVSNVAFKGFVLFAFVNPSVSAALGLVAAGTSIFNFLYTEYNPVQQAVFNFLYTEYTPVQ